MKKLNLLCSIAGLTTLAGSVSVIATSCSPKEADVKELSLELVNSSKSVGSKLEESDLVVKATLTDGTTKTLAYGENGYDVSPYKPGHVFTASEVGKHTLSVVYKAQVKSATLTVTNDQPVVSSYKVVLFGSDQVTCDKTQVKKGEKLEANLSTTVAGATIGIGVIKVGNTALTSSQYIFADNKLTIEADVITDNIGIEVTLQEPVSVSAPIAIRVLTDGEFSLTLNGDEQYRPNLSYSTNGVEWSDYAWTGSIALTAGSTLYIKGDNPNGWNSGYGASEWNYTTINITSDFELGGSLASLIDNGESATDTIPCVGCFSKMFESCGTLLKIDDDFFKDFTKLTPSCYRRMFYYCDNLTDLSGLKLPAQVIEERAYNEMFQYCSSLTAAPELPGTTLRNHCYMSMFSNTGLTATPELPATRFEGIGCYQQMFSECESLTEAAELPATVATNACYMQMFKGCKELVTAPVIALTDLAPNACKWMFKDCIKLENVSDIQAPYAKANCFQGMFQGCKALVTAPVFILQETAESCCESMFSGCSSLTTLVVPIMQPDIELAEKCFKQMFADCIALPSATEAASGEDPLIFTCPQLAYANSVEGMFLNNKYEVGSHNIVQGTDIYLTDISGYDITYSIDSTLTDDLSIVKGPKIFKTDASNLKFTIKNKASSMNVKISITKLDGEIILEYPKTLASGETEFDESLGTITDNFIVKIEPNNP